MTENKIPLVPLLRLSWELLDMVSEEPIPSPSSPVIPGQPPQLLIVVQCVLRLEILVHSQLLGYEKLKLDLKSWDWLQRFLALI